MLETGRIVTIIGAASMAIGTANAQQTGSSDAERLNEVVKDDAVSGGLQEIVVTAQRRNESLQSVPVAVTALSGDDLARRGTTTTEDLQAVVPGFIFTQNLNSVTPVLRGVGSTDSSAAAEGSIGLYVDGVYLSSMTALAMSLTDVERVEVLRGPQGTLFGRNSTGGALQIVTRAPTSDTQAEFGLGYGNYQTVTTDVFLSGGLAPNLAASLSFAMRRQNAGWGRNLNTGEDTGILNEEGVGGKDRFRARDCYQIYSDRGLRKVTRES